MTITTSTSKVVANGNGSATVFSFSPITIFNTGDLLVTKVDTAGVETVLSEGVTSTTYSVQITNPNFLPSIGTVTYPASGGSPLAVGESLVIKREVDLVQQTNLRNQGGYFPEVQEAAFDYDMMVDIQQQEEIDRSIKIPTHITGVSVDLPNPTAGQLIGWNGGATALTNIIPTLTADISSSLIVVSGVAPGLVDGRIWIDTSIAGQRVIRMCDGSDYNEIIRFATADGSLTLANETLAASQPITIALGSAGTPLTKTVTDTGVNGVVEVNDHNSASPAINDVIFSEQFKGRDSAGNTETYAEDRVVLQGVTSATNESAIRIFRTEQGAGTLADRLKIGAGVYTPAQTDKGTDTINASGLYIAGTLVATNEVSIQSGATHSPALADHGKTFIYTNAAGCTVTMPAASTLFPGWYINVISSTANTIAFNRSSTDNIRTKGTDLTTFNLPNRSNSGRLTCDSTGGSAKFYFTGTRTFLSGDRTITAAGSLVIAHGLGVVPDTITTWLHNTTNELGFTGETFQHTYGMQDALAANRGCTIVPDTTNLNVRFGSGASTFAVNHFTTGVSTAITNANWAVQFRCLVHN